MGISSMCVSSPEHKKPRGNPKQVGMMWIGQEGAMRRILACAALLLLAPAAGSTGQVREALAGNPAGASENPAIEVGFSPEGTAESLVLKVIGSARSSIRLAGYLFTSPVIVRALTDARHRGVDVAVMVDYRNNIEDARSRQALNLLVTSGIETRTVDVYPNHHDKYIVVDGRHVETGSFNFTTTAAKRNSENVLVLWNNPKLAGQYIAHWQSRWKQGQPYQSTY